MIDEDYEHKSVISNSLLLKLEEIGSKKCEELDISEIKIWTKYADLLGEFMIQEQNKELKNKLSKELK